MEYEEYPEAVLNRRLNLWQVRLSETIGESTKKGAERKAVIILGAYHEAAKLLSSPVQILNASLAKECNYWQNKTEQLQAKNKELVVKALCLAGTVDEDGDYWGHDTNLGNFDEIVGEILNNE